jgi:hypothetical protein
MIEVQGMYKYGDNGRKFVSCVLKSYEYIWGLDYYSVVTEISTWRPIGFGGSTG